MHQQEHISSHTSWQVAFMVILSSCVLFKIACCNERLQFSMMGEEMQ